MDGQTSTPIENIVNQGSSTMTPGSGDASLEQRPQDPQAAQAQPVTATPTAAPAQPSQQQPSAPPSPADVHAGIFKHTLGLLSGGMNRPVMGANGQPVTDANGQVVMHPAGAKQLGAGILAGAISAMVAGMAAPTQYQTFGEGRGQRKVADYGASVAAGAQAAQPFTQEGSQAKAQKEADDQKGRSLAILDHNLKFRTMSLAADKADREGQQDVVDAHSTMLEGMKDAYENGKVTDEKGNSIELWKNQDITGTEVQKLMVDKQLGITKDMVIPTRVVEVPNEDGSGTHPETLFSVYNPKAVIAMSDSIRKDPQYAQLAGVANGTSLPIRVLASIAMNTSNENLATSSLEGHVKGYNDAVKGSDIPAITEDFDLAAAAKKDPMIKMMYPYIAKYAKDPVDAMFNDFQKDSTIAKNPTLQAASAKLMQAMGVTTEGLEKMKTARIEEENKAKKGFADPEAVSNFSASQMTAFPSVTPGQVKSVYDTYLKNNPTTVDLEKAQAKVEAISKENHASKLADQGVDEKTQKMLLDYGVAGNLKLTLDNAPDEMLVNQHTGNPIPNKSLTAVKASQTEVNRAQFATSVLHLADSLKKAQSAGNLPNAPLVGGITNQLLSKSGLTGEEAQKAMTEISLLQSAATGAHVGGRFSVPVLEKMNKLLSLNMNDKQFLGTLEAITDTMQGYKDNGGRFTVAEWRQLDPKERQRLMGHDEPTPKSNPQPHAPAGAMGTQKFDDGKGNIADYYVDAQGKPLGRK